VKINHAENWSHLQELLLEGAYNEQLSRYRSPWAFRGLSDSTFRLDTTLVRLGGDYARLERHLLRNFMKYAYRDVVKRDSFWHWLSVAQHHRLPTRLLDWTYSPLVAMHFATSNTDKFTIDGAIWAVNYEKSNKLLPDKLKNELLSEGANSFTTEMLANVVSSLDQFDALSQDTALVFFEPPSMDDRIVNQFALFSVMSNAKIGIDSWFEAHPHMCRQIIIPAKIKWEIRDKLDQSNITERVLFPGLDGLSSWLRRHYSPKSESTKKL
jgi:hypothetical protein